jgi:ActR/RegA family two-component response regulator
MTILFMEDDDSMRMIGARLLRKRGHRVMEAADQHEAEVAARNADIDAAVLDVQGAEADTGLRTARVLSRLNPLIRILLVSGGPRPSDNFHFLRKPYDIDDVLHLLSAIDGRDQKP